MFGYSLFQLCVFSRVTLLDWSAHYRDCKPASLKRRFVGCFVHTLCHSADHSASCFHKHVREA